MNRRQLLGSAAVWTLGQAFSPFVQRGWCQPLGPTGPRVRVAAVDIVRESTVIDMLGLFSLDWPRLIGWLNRPDQFGQGDYERLAASGVDIFHPAVEPASRDPHQAARGWISGWRRLLSAHACSLRPVLGVGDLERHGGQGPLGVLVGLQSSEHFRTAADVFWFASQGQRVSQLTYNGPSRLGSGCRVWLDRGLTAFGAEIVAAMNQAGMAIDISHCGDQTGLDAIAASRQPVLITHANCRTLVPRQPRNASDATIRALARSGGVIGITAVRAFVAHGRPTIEHLLDHFDHVARLVGVEHVGIGSDLDVEGRDPISGLPLFSYAIVGLEPALRVFQLTEGLLARGYGRAEIELVLGGNFRRALAAIWPSEPSPSRTTFRDPFCPSLRALASEEQR